jgi:hypothetical protein
VKKTIFILFFILATTAAQAQLLPRYGDSRTGSTGFQFLKINPDARSTGMAESNSAAVNDLAAAYLNPAGLTQLDTSKIHFQFSYAKYYAQSTLQNFTIARKMSKSTFLAANIIYLNSGTMPVTTEFMPTGTGQSFRFTDMSIGVTLAKILTDNFSFGITAKFISEGVASLRTNNVVADFGFQYDIGKANTRFAVGVSNFGSPVSPHGDVVHTTFVGDTTYNVFEKIAVPAVFRLGLATDVIKKEKQLLTVCAQLNHPTDNNETFNLGAEYCWNKMLFVRTGYQLAVDEKGLPSFGFGYLLKRKFGGVRVDYSFSNKKLIGTIHRIGIAINIL